MEVIKDLYGNQEIAVARELTKIYEECIRGAVEEVIDHYTQKQPKGEIVIMISPSQEDKKETSVDIRQILAEKMTQMTLKSAVKEVVTEYGLNKNDVYDLALKIKDEK